MLHLMTHPEIENRTYMTHISSSFEYVVRVYPINTLATRLLSFLLRGCNDNSSYQLDKKLGYERLL